MRTPDTFDPAPDRRSEPPLWSAAGPPGRRAAWTAVVGVVGLLAVAYYLTWLLRPSRVGNPWLFAVLLVAELFNVVQAIGFWWTCAFVRPRRRRPDLVPLRAVLDVDVVIPTYDEAVAVVEPTVAAAARLSGARVHVFLLDDGDRDEMAALALRHRVGYIRRPSHTGAKAGNINHALSATVSPYVLVLDCDHVPRPDLLERALRCFDDSVAFVQTPQYYANAVDNRVAEAAWSQQSLFFGPISRGKDARGAMFCCGTNVVFRRAALLEIGGFPERSVTEDFELSIDLHERGWSSAYLPEVLAAGLGPEDLGAYVSQQHRWARGCVGALGRITRARLPWRLRLQYLLSASYFLTGWTIAVYLAMPIIRIFTGAQPIAGTSADGFLAAFGPYFGMALAAVASVGAGAYTYSAYALATSTFWVHIHAGLEALWRRPGRFVVTPKNADSQRQWRAAAPTLATIGLLAAAAVTGVVRDRGAGSLNNVAFALVHIVVLCHGVATAVAPSTAALNAVPVDEDVPFDVEAVLAA